jgi:hypothetical protein
VYRSSLRFCQVGKAGQAGVKEQVGIPHRPATMFGHFQTRDVAFSFWPPDKLNLIGVVFQRAGFARSELVGSGFKSLVDHLNAGAKTPTLPYIAVKKPGLRFSGAKRCNLFFLF